nr:DUF6240 domain-containing protein [uncultured Niameybacter sp.]
MIDAIKVGQAQGYIIEEMPKREASQIKAEQVKAIPYTLFEVADKQEEIENYYNGKQENLKTKDLTEDEMQILSSLSIEEVADLEKEGFNVETLCGEEIAKTLKNIKEEKGLEKEGYTKKSKTQYNDKIKRLKEHTDSMYHYAMQTKGTLTINDLYKGSFTGTAPINTGTYTKEDVQSVLRMNGLEVNEGNEWATNKLLNLGIDVSEQSVLKIQNIHTAIESLESFEQGQEEVEEIVEAKRENEALVDDEKRLYSKETIESIQEDLAKVDDRTIEEVIKDGEIPSIQNLREKLLKNTKQVTDKIKVDEKNTLKENVINENTISENTLNGKSTVEAYETTENIKKQINEIRARLNTETAQRLSTRLPLESSELAKVAEGLRQVEAEIQEEALIKADIPVTSENKEILGQVMNVATQIGQYKEATTNIQMETEGTATLEAIHQALDLYEVHFSQAEGRFGESIKSVEAQIQQFLETHDLPVNSLSIQSAKALITNGMDLTVENLESAISAMSQINEFLEVMTPYEAAKLIKEGVNPYKASIGTILEWSRESEMIKTKESIAKSIVSLEEKGQINEEQKKSLIGLYKILNGVLNNKEQVAGYLFKNGLPLTVEQLEEATKYAGKNSHIEVGIDDEFGSLESLNYETKSGRTLIQEASTELKKLLDAVKMAENMPFELEAMGTDEFTTFKSMIMPFVRGTIKKELGKFDGVNTLPESILEKIEVVKNVPKEVVETMKQHKIPLTLTNIYWVDQMAKDPDLYKELLRKTGVDKGLEEDNLPRKKEEFEKVLEELEHKATYYKEQSMEQGDVLNYKSYKQLEEMLDVQKQLMNKEGIYQIPYMINGETKMVQFYMKEESAKKDLEKESITGVMRYETKKLGTVTTYFTIKGDHIGYQMQAESSQAAEALEKAKSHLQGLFKQLGYEVSRETYEVPKEAKAPVLTSLLKGDSEFEAII